MTVHEPHVVVEQVLPGVTYALRQEVLRPGMRPDQVRFPGDDAPLAEHFAAYDVEDRIVGVVAVLPAEIEPGRPGWRLRGMAVAEGRRGEGIGRALLDRVLEAVARHGGGLLWCQARAGAAGFYRRAGFVPDGEPWTDPRLGPHIRMTRQVAAA